MTPCPTLRKLLYAFKVAADVQAVGAASGTYDGGSWLVTTWFSGPSTWKVFTDAGEGTGGREAALRGGADLCRSVAGLHASGWVHADLQPSHGIHTPAGVRLIDFAWSWCEGEEPVSGFRGGIVHLMAPEIAAAVAHGDGPATPTRSSDTYALAGVLWTCTSGGWPLDCRGHRPEGLRPGRGSGCHRNRPSVFGVGCVARVPGRHPARACRRTRGPAHSQRAGGARTQG